MEGWTRGWQLIRLGNIEDGVACLSAIHQEQTRPINPCEAGYAMLFAACYDEAIAHFDSAIDIAKNSSDILFALAGVARWCAGSHDEAVRTWNDGRSTSYAVAGTATLIPSLLLFANSVRPDLDGAADAVALMEQRLDARRPMCGKPKSNSYGAIGALVLGQMTAEDVRKLGLEYDGLVDTSDTRQIAFWSGVHKKRIGDDAGFRESMTSVANVTWEHFDNDPSAFIGAIWCPEFYLARDEVSRS